jgi:hypothetical protein
MIFVCNKSTTCVDKSTCDHSKGHGPVGQAKQRREARGTDDETGEKPTCMNTDCGVIKDARCEPDMSDLRTAAVVMRMANVRLAG